jgi:hypothetical protein
MPFVDRLIAVVGFLGLLAAWAWFVFFSPSWVEMLLAIAGGGVVVIGSIKLLRSQARKSSTDPIETDTAQR